MVSSRRPIAKSDHSSNRAWLQIVIGVAIATTILLECYPHWREGRSSGLAVYQLPTSASSNYIWGIVPGSLANIDDLLIRGNRFSNGVFIDWRIRRQAVLILRDRGGKLHPIQAGDLRQEHRDALISAGILYGWEPEWVGVMKANKMETSQISLVRMLIDVALLLGFCLAGLLACNLMGRWILRRRAIGRATTGRCGACGYVLRGLETSICPECGRNVDAGSSGASEQWRDRTE